MTVKLHSGKADVILTWENVNGLLEVKVVDQDHNLLWYLVEETDEEIRNMDRLLEDRFYVPVYFTDWGQAFYKTCKTLMLVVESRLATPTIDRTRFISIGEDGFLEPQEFPADQLIADLNEGHLLPMRRADDGPGALEVDPMLRRFH